MGDFSIIKLVKVTAPTAGVAAGGLIAYKGSVIDGVFFMAMALIGVAGLMMLEQTFYEHNKDKYG